MKNYFFTATILLSLAYSGVQAQGSKRDSIANSISDYVQSVETAGNIFLNKSLTDSERLRAITPYPFIYNSQQAELFKRIVLDNAETPEVRAMALNKIYKNAEDDDSYFSQIVRLFANPQTPKPLRDETLYFINSVSFTSLPGVLDVYHQMVEDPDQDFRVFAVSKLMMNGDARIQQLLINNLKNEGTPLFDPVQTIELLSIAPKKEYYPAVYQLLLETKHEPTRLAAIQVLGPYVQAREKLKQISTDPNESEQAREFSLRALYSGDKDNIVKYVTPILLDKTAPDRLKALGIQMSIDVRKPMSYRRSKQAAKPDQFDYLVLSISEGQNSGNSSELVDIANRYLLLVKPNF